MLAAHSAAFSDSGLVSMLAAFLLHSALCSLSPRSASLVLWAHVALWPLCISEFAGAFWGTNKFLAIAGAQAGAPGGTPLQEAIVGVCHIFPSLALIAAWGLLVSGVWGVYKRDASAARTSK
jgi:hypothetical protein